MAAFEVLALDTATPQIRAPGVSDTYTFPRQALFLAGTTAAPGIAQTSDDNTGMWWPAADTLAWSLGGTEQMRLTSTGLGIGTSSPGVKLDVAGTDIYRVFRVSTATGGVIEAGLLSQSIIGIQSLTNGGSFQNLILQPNGGNVGIGTSSPGAKLHVATAGNNYIVSHNTAGSTSALLLGAESGQNTIYSWTTVAGSTGRPLAFYTGPSEAMRLDTSGNLGLGVTPSASNLPTIESQYGLFVGQGQTNIVANAYYSSGYLYKSTAAASRYQQITGQHIWYTAPSGTAGNTISFTQALTLDVNRNLALNTTSVGTSAVGALSIGSGTEPSSGPADTVQLYSVDRSAGNTIPAFYCEGTGVTDAGITNTTVTHKIAMKINGTVYYLLATTNAT